jgi:hypothetical protein
MQQEQHENDTPKGRCSSRSRIGQNGKSVPQQVDQSMNIFSILLK